METGCRYWSATSSIHCSRLNPRAAACALNAASFSGGRSRVTIIAGLTFPDYLMPRRLVTHDRTLGFSQFFWMPQMERESIYGDQRKPHLLIHGSFLEIAGL